MRERMLQPKAAWAEDRATQRCDPSADPGAKTGAWASHSLALLPFYLLRDWHGSDKPSWHDAATLLAGCLPQLANAKRQEFQFPLNQDTQGRNRERPTTFTMPVLVFSLRIRCWIG